MQPGQVPVIVVMPVQGPVEAVRRSLASLSAQTLADLQVMLIASHRLSIEQNYVACCEYAQKDSRFTVLTADDNTYCGLLNAGLMFAQQAHPQYLGFFAPGNQAEPSLYQRLYFLADRESAQIVSCRHCYVDPTLHLSAGQSSSWRHSPRTPLKAERPLVQSARQFQDDVQNRSSSASPDIGTVVLSCDQAATQLIAGNPDYRASLYCADFLEAIDAEFQYARALAPQDLPFTVTALCSAQSVVLLDQFLLARSCAPGLCDRQDALCVIKGSQKAIRILYARNQLSRYGEAMVSCIVRANRRPYAHTPPEWRRCYAHKLADLFNWLKAEGVPIDQRNPYLTAAQVHFINDFV